MRPVEWKDRKQVIDIISETFEDNPGSIWLFRKNVNPKRAIRSLANYVFLKAYNRKGVYLSDNEMGMALAYKFNRKSFSIVETWYLLRFFILYGNLTKLKEIKYREEYRDKQRPANGEYIYGWFLGVKRGGEKAVFELAREIGNIAGELKLPIYLETSMERNMRVYSRYGYEVFHFWEEKDKNIQFWFLKKECSK